eukprot:513059-Rhodomonas_salina.2
MQVCEAREQNRQGGNEANDGGRAGGERKRTVGELLEIRQGQLHKVGALSRIVPPHVDIRQHAHTWAGTRVSSVPGPAVGREEADATCASDVVHSQVEQEQRVVDFEHVGHGR